jgi:hypothetical protein
MLGVLTIWQFIAEMKNPEDFPKGTFFHASTPSPSMTLGSLALWAVTIAEVILYTLCGAIMYNYVGGSHLPALRGQAKKACPIGNQYITAPAFGSLTTVYKKIAFSFAIPTIIFLGALYSVSLLSPCTHAITESDYFSSR